MAPCLHWHSVSVSSFHLLPFLLPTGSFLPCKLKHCHARPKIPPSCLFHETLFHFFYSLFSVARPSVSISPACHALYSTFPQQLPWAFNLLTILVCLAGPGSRLMARQSFANRRVRGRVAVSAYSLSRMQKRTRLCLTQS